MLLHHSELMAEWARIFDAVNKVKLFHESIWMVAAIIIHSGFPAKTFGTPKHFNAFLNCWRLKTQSSNSSSQSTQRPVNLLTGRATSWMPQVMQRILGSPMRSGGRVVNSRVPSATKG